MHAHPGELRAKFHNHGSDLRLLPDSYALCCFCCEVKPSCDILNHVSATHNRSPEVSRDRFPQATAEFTTSTFDSWALRCRWPTRSAVTCARSFKHAGFGKPNLSYRLLAIALVIHARLLCGRSELCSGFQPSIFSQASFRFRNQFAFMHSPRTDR